MQIFVYGEDARLTECRRLLYRAEEEGLLPEKVGDIHLLPIPSWRMDVDEVRCALLSRYGENKGEKCQKGEEKPSPCQKTQGACQKNDISSVKAQDKEEDASFVIDGALPNGTIHYAVGYEVPSFLYEVKGVQVIDLALCERFLWRNARLCALGTLGILLTEHSRVPSELSFGVIGYGRIGREVCSLLSYLEARLVVFTSGTEAAAELKEKQIPSVLVNWKEKTTVSVNQTLQNHGISSPIDILINTSPAPLGAPFYEGFTGTVYDLASGSPIPKEVPHTRLSSLPMRMYAQSAGRAVYQAVLDFLCDFQ